VIELEESEKDRLGLKQLLNSQKRSRIEFHTNNLKVSKD
jgi:hypothetical protein